MKKYKITANKDCKLHLYDDSEFAALFWNDIESDSTSQGNDEITTIHLKKGESLEVESFGFEFVDDQLVYYLNVTQVFSSKDILETTASHMAWVPSHIIDLRREKTENFSLFRIQ